MQIVMIHGQNHAGSTCTIGRNFIEKLGSGNTLTEFFLPRDLNHFCLGCYRCVENDAACPYYAEKRRIMEAVEKAELLVFTTPNYCLNMSAPLKSFFDLTFNYWMPHRPRACMFKKRAVIFTTSAGAGPRPVIEAVKKDLVYWGVPKIYAYGVRVATKNWAEVSPEKKEKIDRDLERLAGKVLKNPSPKPGLVTRGLFFMMGKVQRAGLGSSPIEKQYWAERGWPGRNQPWKRETKF